MSFTLFIGDLSSVCTIDDIEREFSPFGEIVDIRITIDPQTGQSLLYGFVEYNNEVSANDALTALNGKVLSGRSMR